MSAASRWDPHKIDAMAQMAGAVADDFRTVLATILDHAARLDDEIDPNDPRARSVAGIRAAAELGTSLTRQLQTFGARRTIQPAILDVNAVIARERSALQRVVGDRVTIRIDAAPDLRAVRADAGHLAQMLVNLAANARDAMPDGGTVAIETANASIDGDAARERNVAPGAYVRVAVADSGMGIGDDVRPHLFEPFFTTKPRDRATGLGLSTVYGIVTQSGGHVLVESEIGRGARFSVFLPALVDEAAPPEAASEPARERESGTVLLVDEDASVRSLVTTVLRRRGYQVLCAAASDEAVAAAADFDGAIDLLLVDEQLAGERSPLEEAIRERRAGIRMLPLRKPFTPDSLAARVRASLERR